MDTTISIGLIVPGDDCESAFKRDGDFETFHIVWRDSVTADQLKTAAFAAMDHKISALGVYGNSLTDDATVEGIREAIRACESFGTDLVGCFAGRVTGASIPDSVERFKKVFSELASEAADHGVRLALENCLQGGNWFSGDRNIAHNPAAWELLFDAVPAENLGLQWEPAHQLCQLIEPLPQLRQWAPKIFHIHGKDAFVRHEVIRTQGVGGGPEPFAEFRFPGSGDTDWSKIFAELRLAGFEGSIDIEGAHDKTYPGDKDADGCLAALRYLRRCRG